MWKHLIFVFGVLVVVVSAQGLNVHDDLTAQSESHCECSKYDCGCCDHIDWSYLGLNGTVCTNFSYLPKDYGVSITVTWNTRTLFNDTISARNPPPFCFGIPDLEKISAHICVRLYDLKFEEKHFHGCGKLSISVYHVVHRSVNLGCFDIPKKPPAKSVTSVRSGIRGVIGNHVAESFEFWKHSAPEVNMI